MLAKTTLLLRHAQRNGYAVGGFNIYNLEGLQAVIAAAEAVNSPALVQLHPAALDHGGMPLVTAALRAATDASVPVGVHLDHCTDIDTITEFITAGVRSVMADGSHLEDAMNINFVARVVTLARDADNACVEGELGRISGTEDGLTVELIHARMTDPQQAADFVVGTGIDALAVCIGNVHGRYPFEPQLDFDRLAAIRAVVDVPLVLHGASGLPPDQITRSIELGVCKFNVNTEVRTAFVKALYDGLSANPPVDLLPLMRAGRQAMQEIITGKMHLFRSVNRAPSLTETM